MGRPILSQKEIEKKQKDLNRKYNLLSGEVGSSTMDLVNDIVALELELEHECEQ